VAALDCFVTDEIEITPGMIEAGESEILGRCWGRSRSERFLPPPYSGAQRARPGRRKSQRCQIRPQADPHPAPAAKGSQALRSGRDAVQRSPQLLCQPEHDVEIGVMNRRFQKELPKGFDEIRERARQALSPLKPADDNDDPSRTS
jgi:hypothetical protein